MAKLNAPWDNDRILGLKGTLDFYQWKGLNVVRSWPRTNYSSLTPQTKAQWGWFRYITKQWKVISPSVGTAYAEMANGTQRAPRDYQFEVYRNYSVTINGA